MTNEEIIKGLTKMLNNTIEANECGLSNNDFKDDIELLKSALSLIEKQEKEIDILKNHVHYKVCENCKNEFISKRSDAKYCKECAKTVNNKEWYKNLTDEQYRKVIENAQMDTSNDTVVAHRFAVMQQQINEKDKQIQELETKLEFKEYGDLDNLQFEEYMNQFVPKQAIIDLIENKTINISGFECVAIEDIQELLGGEK